MSRYRVVGSPIRGYHIEQRFMFCWIKGNFYGANWFKTFDEAAGVIEKWRKTASEPVTVHEV